MIVCATMEAAREMGNPMALKGDGNHRFEALCRHEAGHVVMALKDRDVEPGITLHGITIDLVTGGKSDITLNGNFSFQAIIYMLCGGPVAEAIYLGMEPGKVDTLFQTGREGDPGDGDVLHEMIAMYEGDNPGVDFEAEADLCCQEVYVAMTEDEGVREAVGAIAEALMEKKGKLSAEEIEGIYSDIKNIYG